MNCTYAKCLLKITNLFLSVKVEPLSFSFSRNNGHPFQHNELKCGNYSLNTETHPKNCSLNLSYCKQASGDHDWLGPTAELLENKQFPSLAVIIVANNRLMVF